jgi:putative DNA primase/helicase
MSAARIAAALGCARQSGQWWSCRCPAHDDRHPSLCIRDGDRALIVKCWAGCQPQAVLAALRSGGLLRGSQGYRRPTINRNRLDTSDDADKRTAWAARMWDCAQGALRTPVTAYLRTRGITIDPPAVLRYVPTLRRPDGSSGPAMVARVDDVDGRLIGVHRTWFWLGPAGEWRRRDRASLGPVRGGAVCLSPAAETLLIGEGIETCLAAMTATAMSGWAALSTSGLTALILPPVVRTVIILADHDLSGAGELAARTAAERWLREGRRVRIALPPKPGTDMADVLTGYAYSRVQEARDDGA